MSAWRNIKNSKVWYLLVNDDIVLGWDLELSWDLVSQLCVWRRAGIKEELGSAAFMDLPTVALYSYNLLPEPSSTGDKPQVSSGLFVIHETREMLS